jgi:hypothetical protein
MAEINVTLSQIQSQNVDTVKYNADDVNLLGGNLILRQFGLSNDYVEQVLYDIAGNLIDINYNYVNQQIQQTLVSPENTTSEVVINPESDLQQLGTHQVNLSYYITFLGKRLAMVMLIHFILKKFHLIERK